MVAEWLAPEGLLRVRVIDSGRGLSPEGLGRIFSPFVQAEEKTREMFGGTGADSRPAYSSALRSAGPHLAPTDFCRPCPIPLGLGLALSRDIAMALGGDLSLASEGLGRGCTATMTIRLPQPPQAPGDRSVMPVHRSLALGLLGATTSVGGGPSGASGADSGVVRWPAEAHSRRVHRGATSIDELRVRVLSDRPSGHGDSHLSVGPSLQFVNVLHRPSADGTRRSTDATRKVSSSRGSQPQWGPPGAADSEGPWAEQSPAASAWCNSAQQAAPLRVIAAEDDALCRKILNMLLNQAGFSAEVVADGLAASEALAIDPRSVDLLILDQHMARAFSPQNPHACPHSCSCVTPKRAPVPYATSASQCPAALFRFAALAPDSRSLSLSLVLFPPLPLSLPDSSLSQGGGDKDGYPTLLRTVKLYFDLGAPRPRIVVLSGESSSGDAAVRMRDAGADDVLEKPVSLRAMRELRTAMQVRQRLVSACESASSGASQSNTGGAAEQPAPGPAPAPAPAPAEVPQGKVPPTPISPRASH